MNPQVRSDGDSPKKRNTWHPSGKVILPAPLVVVWCSPRTLYSRSSKKKKFTLHPTISFHTLPHSTWYLHASFYPYQALDFSLKARSFWCKLFTTYLDNPYPTCLQIYSNQLWITLGFLFPHVTCTPKSVGPINQGQFSSQLHYSLPLSMIPLLPPTNYSLLPTHWLKTFLHHFYTLRPAIRHKNLIVNMFLLRSKLGPLR